MWEPDDYQSLISDHIDRIPLNEISKKHNTTSDKIRGWLQRNDHWIPYKSGKIELPELQVIELYKNDYSVDEIATRFGVSSFPIVKILKEHNIRKPNWLKGIPYSKMEQLLDKKYFQDAIDRNVGLHHIMEDLSIGEYLVHSLCKYHNIKLVGNSGKVRSILNRRKRNAIPFTEEEFKIQHFEYNRSQQDIANSMGVSIGYLRKHVRKWEVLLNDTRIDSKFRELTCASDEVLQNLINNNTIATLCTQYNVGYDTFRKLLIERNIQIPAKFRSNGERTIELKIREYYNGTIEICNRKIIYPYELDIYLPEKQIAIEYCGLYWHSELKGKTQNYHLRKLKLCKEKGIRLITIFEDEFIQKYDIVISKIVRSLSIQPPLKNINARQCTVKHISHKEKEQFLNTNHIQGNDKSKIRLGLFDKEDRLVSVMTFAKPSRSRTSVNIMNKENIWELNRFATDISCNVRGGAGKLLKFFQRNYDWNEIYSYADLRWSTGQLYTQLGFTHVHNSPPNYWYSSKGYYKREYRYNYTKFKLVEQGYDPLSTESQIMKSRGFTRIWDCGSMKFEIKKEA